MPDVTITIGSPTLTAGQVFRTRYRLLPAGAWSSYVDRDNSPFVLSGLAAGNYELQVILVKADETECPVSTRTFTVIDPVVCIDFSAEIVSVGSLFYLSITYTPPMTNPPCGWDFIVNGNTINYATLPASPLLIPTTNTGQVLIIRANGCSDNVKTCFNEDIATIDPPCTPMVIGSVSAVFTGTYPNGDRAIKIIFPYTQSSPASKTVALKITQKNVKSGAPWTSYDPTFGAPLGLPTTGSPAINYNVAANSNVFTVLDEGVDKKQYIFDWLIVDGCGKTHSGTVQILG